MQNMTSTLADGTRAYFLELCREADNWDGSPMFEGGSIEKGYLTNLKKADLVTTDVEEGITWIFFTEKGEKARKEIS